MCGSIILGVFLGVLALKAARRIAFHHHGGGCGAFSHHGGPCGGGHGGRRFMYYRWGGGWGGRHGHGGYGAYGHDDGAFGVRSGRPASKPISEVLRALELNERQRQEAAPVLTLAQEWLGPAGPRIEAALLAVAGDRFEPVLIEGLLEGAPEPVRRELTEGLEHLHTILISEQREQLRNQLSRGKTPGTGSTSGAGGAGGATGGSDSAL